MAKHQPDRIEVMHLKPPIWTHPSWWQERLEELAPKTCGRRPSHGDAPAYFSILSIGRALGYRCRVCGWDETVLVQEGAGEPCKPITPDQAKLLPFRPPRLGAHRGTSEGGSGKKSEVW